MMDENDDMIPVWVWWNTKGEHQKGWPNKILCWHKNLDDRSKSEKVDLEKHPMCVEIEALAHLAGYDPDYPDDDASEDFTIPAEWWGNPEILIDPDR